MHTRSLARWTSCALLAGAALVFVSGARAQPKRPIELEDLFRLKRVSDPQLSPDGSRVAYVVTEVLKDENRTNADVWIANADGTGMSRPLTNSPKRDAHPRWSPDGKRIAFESTRSGESQIWLIAADGGEARPLTTISTGAAQPVWAPDGKSLAFVSAVFAEFSEKPFKESDKLNKERLDAQEKSKVKARLFDALLFRHWDAWVEGKRQHLFVVPVADGAAAGEPRDVTPGPNDAVPTSDTFSAGDDFAFSPDGDELAFTAPPLPLREQAWSTNHDIWTVNLATGARKNLTEANLAADGFPRYSPDGKFIAYRAQSRPGFESDRWRLVVQERATGARRLLANDIDAWIENLAWAPDGRSIYVEAEDKGAKLIWRVSVADGGAKKITAGEVSSDLSLARGGDRLVFMRSSMTQPPEVFGLETAKGSEATLLTHTNDALRAKIVWNAPESVTVAGAGGTPVQMWILKPPGFDAAKKWPLVFWVHGGPQGSWLDSWSTRWNPQVWAAQGYVIAMPNPRGSTGFGQKFTDEISHDWGGKVYDDLMACLAHLEKQPWIEATRMAAAGASYGGYMMNWLNGHTDKFRCIVNHDGVYNFDSMFGTTEEVWFDAWEHGIPWENPDFNQFSPHRFAANFKTPTLIIHNDLDFRVPISEGLALFTTLQRKGIPSKLLMFPDEGHWVLKPANSELWHKTIFEWLAEYLKK